MSGLKSSRWFMFFHSYTSSRKTHSLLWKFVWECVCAKKQILRGMFSERFCFIPARRSGYLLHETHPNPPAASDGMESLITSTRESSSSPDAALEVTVWRPLYWAERVKSFLLQSRLKSKGSQNTTAATSCQQTSGYNWKHTRSEAPSADAGLAEDKSSPRVQERDSNN